MQVVVLVLGGGFDTRALRFSGLRGVEVVETDLPDVVAAKRDLISRRLQRRSRAPLALPTLDALDMNDAADRARFVSTTLRSAIERARRAADSAARHSHAPDARSATGPARAAGVRVLVLAEATLLYVQPGSAAATVSAVFGECKREALEAAARGAPSARAGAAQLLFADRLPDSVLNTRGEAGVRTLDTPEALASERAAVERWLLATANLRLDQYQIKPGLARQMGVASVQF